MKTGDAIGRAGVVGKLIGAAGFAWILASSVYAQAWNQTAAGTTYLWTDTANWDTGTVPNVSGASVTMNTALAGDQTITLNQDITLGSLTLGTSSGSNKYTIATGAANKLIFDNGASEAVITHVSTGGADGITGNIQLSSGGLRIVNAGTNGLGALVATITGTGNLILDGGVSNGGTVNNVGTITFVTNSGNTTTNFFGATVGANVTSLIINRSGQTVAISGNNSNFAGNVDIQYGTLRVTNTNALNSKNTINFANGYGNSIMDVQSTVTVGGLNGSGRIQRGGSTGTFTLLLMGDGTYSFDMGNSYDSGGTSKLALVVALTFNGSQTFTGIWNMSGGVTVNNGTFIIGNSNTFAGSNYSMGAFILNGGTLASSVSNINLATSATGGANMSFTMNGGTLDLNGASAGSMTMGNMGSGSAASSFTLTAGTIKLTLNSAVNYDKIIGVSSGTFTITGGTIDFGNTVLDYTATYQVLSGFGSGSVSGLTFLNYDTSNYFANLSNSGILSFTAIPEPSTWAMLVAGMVCLGGMQMFLKRRALQA